VRQQPGARDRTEDTGGACTAASPPSANPGREKMAALVVSTRRMGYPCIMRLIFPAVLLFSAISFLCYGVSCLLTVHMKQEFDRFGLARFRQLTAVLQLVGALGLLAGFALPILGCVAAAGLALQMLLGFAVRLKIRDGVIQSSPALFYLGVNLYLAVGFAARLSAG
jgi:hypothetical protein